MKRLGRLRTEHGGYTIIEALIVLAASGALVITVISLISGQQGKTQFAQAARDADSRFQDITNDFATGYFSRGGAMSCSANATGDPPTINAVSSQQGKNIGCIYIGRIFQIGTDSNYTLHTMVGRQYTGGILSPPTTTLTEADARLIHPTSANGAIPNLSETGQFNNGIELQRVVFLNSSNSEQDAGPFGVVSNFGTIVGSNLASDKQTGQLMIFTSNYATGLDLANKFNTGIVAGTDYVLNRPLALCFTSRTSNQHAIIRFGTTAGSTASITTIGGGNTCPADLIP